MSARVYFDKNKTKYYDLDSGSIFINGKIQDKSLSGDSKNVFNRLIRNKGKTLNRATDFEGITCRDLKGRNPVDQKISPIRTYLSRYLSVGRNDIIKTIHGTGYMYIGPALEEDEIVTTANTISEKNSCDLDLYLTYYTHLFENSHKINFRDKNDDKSRNIIDFYVEPTLKQRDKECGLGDLFVSDRPHNLLLGKSGYGKSIGMKIVVAAIAADFMMKNGIEHKELNGKRKKAYADLYNCIFGNIDKRPFPVFIEARYANTEEYKELYELADKPTDIYKTKFHEMLDKARRTGTLILIIDAVDEVDTDHKYEFNICIDKFKRSNPRSKVIVTSRFSTDDFSEYDIYSLCNFSSKNVNELLQKYSELLGKGKIDKVKDFIDRSEPIAQLMGNPHILTGVIHENNYESVTQVIGGAIERIIANRWNDSEKIEDIMKLLGRLAVEMVFKNKCNDLKPARIRALFTEVMSYIDDLKMTVDEVNRFADSLAWKSGIMDYQEGVYSFQDGLIKQYFAAYYIYTYLLRSTLSHSIERMENNKNTKVFIAQKGQVNERNLFFFMAKLSAFVLEFSGNEKLILNYDQMVVFNILVSMLPNREHQTAMMNYMIILTRGDKDNKRNYAIGHGLCDMLERIYGPNQITNALSDGGMSEGSKLIIQCLKEQFSNVSTEHTEESLNLSKRIENNTSKKGAGYEKHIS